MFVLGFCAVFFILSILCLNCDKYKYRCEHHELANKWENEYFNKPKDEVPRDVWHYKKVYNFMNGIDEWDDVIVPLFIVDVVLLFLMFLVIIANYSSAPYDIQSRQAEYEVIMYQIENNMYRYNNAGTDVKVDSNGNAIDETVVVGYGQYQLMQEVKEWNSWITGRDVMENNWALGIFYPKFSDKLFPIDLSVLDFNNIY